MPQQSQMVSFMVFIVARRDTCCLHVWRRGWLVGWLVGWLSPRGSEFVCLRFSWGLCGGVRIVLWAWGVSRVPLVSAWGVSRERACLCEVCGWVGNVEVVAFLEELFGF